VLVTGSSGAIGSVVVQAFLAAGAHVSGFDIREPGQKYESDRLHLDIVDVTDEARLDRAFETAREKFGVITTCIALAGLDLSYLANHSLCDMPLDQWRRTMRVNVDGTFLTCRAWLRGIKSYATTETRNVSAVVIGSEAGSLGVSVNAAYSTSKAAIQFGLVRSLARDVVAIHPRARVNAVAPGPVDTPQFRRECADDPEALWRESQATVAMKVPVKMEAVARACLFLVSENFAGHITGKPLTDHAAILDRQSTIADGQVIYDADLGHNRSTAAC